MKNKFFNILFASVLIILVLFFILLIISLIFQLESTTSIRGINKKEIFFAIRLTLFTATISSILALIVSLPVAYILSRNEFPLKGLIDAFLYLPIVVSPVALGAMLLTFFNTPLGRFIENNLFRIVFEVPAIIFAQFVVIVGLSISLIKSVFEYIDPIYENTARTLGATKFMAFTKVLLPLSKNGIIAAFLLTWARAVGEFGATVMLAGATTMKTETLPVAVFLSFASADIHGASILILISLGISLCVLFFIRMLWVNNRKQ